MTKKIRYFLFLLFICLFFFLSAKHYISDENKKKSYRTLSSIDQMIEDYTKKLPVLEDDTNNIIEYVEYRNDKNKKKYFFWELLKND